MINNLGQVYQNTPTIVCVDDEKIILDSLRTHLRNALNGNFNIEIAEGSVEALEIINELIEKDDPPFLIISDQIMPEMNGDELLFEVKQVSPKTLAILLTGQANKEDIINAINNAGLYRYIAKPWDEEDLVLTVKQAIRAYLSSQQIEDQRDQLLSLNSTLEKKVEKRTEKINHQKKELELKNKEITDSINYAKRIQDVLLPDSSCGKSVLDSFILFKPLNIVSGDFYWYFENKEIILFTVIDCTGHGVPGAFMTVIANNLLYNIIKYKQILKPNLILEELNKAIVGILKQRTSGIRDGMDISVVSFKKKEKVIEFSGAMHSLVFVQDGKLNQIKGDRIPIGGIGFTPRKYTLHSIQILSSTHFYMYTDGYQDQFGGQKGKKYMVRNLNQKLSEISSLPLKEQKVILEETFEDWRGNHEQIDDVLLVGFKIK